jgi:hypothetical protein
LNPGLQGEKWDSNRLMLSFLTSNVLILQDSEESEMREISKNYWKNMTSLSIEQLELVVYWEE